MRDYRKFCRPKAKKNPQIGDVLVTLNCGLNLYVDDEDFSRIKKSFKKYSIVGNRLSRPGYIKIYNSALNEDMIISPEDYNNLFEIKEIVGLKLILDANNPALDGDIICQNSIINREIIFSYEDWINLDDSWNTTGLYGIETFDNDDEVTELRYVIMANGTTFIIKAEDYSKVSNHWENVETIDWSPIIDGHEYVDLGLPSGTKWATMNVGANSITDYGNYYQYGKGAAQYAETNGQSDYSGTENPLAASVDTAVQVWGGSWHMPTSAQCQELIDNTTYEWVVNFNGSGVNGATFTANGKTLFIPAAGDFDSGELYDKNILGYIRTCTLRQKFVSYALCIGYQDPFPTSVDYTWGNNWGISVRPVVG